MAAYFSAGVNRLVRKESPEEIARLGEQGPGTVGAWGQFTERARSAISLAHEEARRLGHRGIGTEHLLVGMVREDNLGAGALERLGAAPAARRREVELRATRGQDSGNEEGNLTSEAKRVIDLAFAEARALRHNYLGCEHLLLGLLRDAEGLAAKVLAQFGVDLDAVHREMTVVGAWWFEVLEARRRLQEAEAAYRAFVEDPVGAEGWNGDRVARDDQKEENHGKELFNDK